MAICTECGRANDAAQKFCGDCGTRLTPPSEYTPAHLARRILDEGARIEARGPAGGERKTVTALFADIKGSVEMMEELDPEDARAIVDPALEIMMEAVHHYDGYVVRTAGDGIHALFGAPIALEDHPQRAVHAALRMQQEIRRYTETPRAEGNVPLQVRVGLNTGDVVLRSIRTRDLHTDYDSIGHTTNLAARMESLAEPGTVLLSEATYRLTEGYFEFRSLGAVPIKGVREPVPTYEALRPRPETRFSVAARRGLAQFVGRDSERAEIERSLELALTGHGRILAVVGEPGVGKSRLFYELKALVPPNALLLVTACASYGKAHPYLPLIALLQSYFEIRSGDAASEQREAIARRIEALDPALGDAVPYLHHVLGIAAPGESLGQMDPGVRRKRTFDGLVRLFLAEAPRRPVILVFEDLQWLDGESEAFLTTLAAAIASSPVLLLVNYRPEHRPRWADGTAWTLIELEPLEQSRAAELLSALLPDAPGLAPLADSILEKAQGNPFFIEEIARSLVGRGTSARGLGDIRIPPTVEGVLAARIDRLDAEEKTLLQTLAVVGTEFPASFVDRVAESFGPLLSALLARLAQQQFIRAASIGAEPGYRFHHALTHDVAYQSLLKERRRALHEDTAHAIEEIFAGRLGERSAELAHHYGRSGNAPKAIQYLRMAAQRSVERSALPDAIAHLRSALELVPRLPESPARLQEEVAIRLALGTSLGPHRGWFDPEVGQSFDRARELCGEVGETPHLFPALFGLWVYELTHGDLERARELAEELETLGERFDNSDFVIEAARALGPTVFFLGDLHRARGVLERGIARYDPVAHAAHAHAYGQDPKVLCLSYEAVICLLQGNAERAAESSRQALELAETIRHPFTLACALNFAATVAYFDGDAPAAESFAQRTVRVSAENAFPFWLVNGRVIHAWALARRGDSSGLEQMRRDLEAWRVSGADVLRPWFLDMLGEALATFGYVDEAAGALEEAIRVGEETHARWTSAESHRLLAEIQASRGELAEAEASLGRACEIARAQGAKTFESRASSALSRLAGSRTRATEERAS